SLGMTDVMAIQRMGSDYVLDTGSPHYVSYVTDCQSINVIEAARAIRYNAPFKEKGINVNFVEINDQGLALRTYERGVENETLACGTGVTAAAITLAIEDDLAIGAPFDYPVSARGGALRVSGRRTKAGFIDLRLVGPAEKVFVGTVEV
ncbi:MAG: diaminopimelate epimerase, partial [Bacteroidota bacterium]